MPPMAFILIICDLRIYTFSDTTLHALLAKRLLRDLWIAIYIYTTESKKEYLTFPGIHLSGVTDTELIDID